MIIARSPLRISLGGGGTDLPSYYREHEGFVISAAINKYVYVSVMRPFSQGIYLKYSELERVRQIAEVKHPIIREALAMLKFKTPQIEITTLADIPAGTCLGSSGSFTTALLKALYAHRRRMILPNDLARLACEIEINKLNEPVGKQDQYISAYGGITCFDFHPDDTVTAFPLPISMNTLNKLESNLMLFFTGFYRRAGEILKDQNVRSQNNDKNMMDNLHFTKEIGLRSRKALEAGRCVEFGKLLHKHWQHKKKRSKGMSNPQIDEWYKLARNNGAIGGKLIGAGGGGFFLLYAENHVRLRRVMAKIGLEEVRFHFDFEGTKVLLG